MPDDAPIESGNATVKLSQETHERIDRLIKQGRYRTKTDFMRQAIHWYLNQEEYYENLDATIRKWLNEGKYDDLINKRKKD